MRVSTATRRQVAGAFLLGAAVAALSATLSFGAAGDASVTIDNFAFGPQQLTVKAGTTVTWVNEDDIPHTVVATDKSFRSAALDTDDKFSFTFAAPGSYQYFCSLHPHMTATVTVTQ